MRVSVVDTPQGLASLKESWSELLGQARQSSPFVSPAWLEACWDVYADPRDRLHVICCREEGTDTLTGVFPAYVQHTTPFLTARRLRNLGDTRVGSAHLGCIADAAVESETFRAITDHLCLTHRDWDVLDLGLMDAKGPFLAHLQERLREAGFRMQAGDSADCPSMTLPDSWGGYLSTLSHRQRGTIRRDRRRLESLGAVGTEVIADPGGLEEALHDVTRMFESSMRRKFQRPFVVSDRYRRFIMSVSAQFLALGWLRLLFLTVDGRRVAFVYQFRYRDTMYAYQTGFEDEWESCHVGMGVFGHAIEGAIGEGCSRYDFGPGKGEHKLRLGATDRCDLRNARVYAPSAAGVIGARCDAASRCVRHAVRAVSPPSVSLRLRRRSDWQGLTAL